MDNQKTQSGKPLFFVASVLTAAFVSYLIGSQPMGEGLLTDITLGSLVIGLISGFILALGVAWFVINEKHHEQLLAEAVINPESGLYTRHYMNEIAPRFVAIHQRDANAGFAVSLFSLDELAISQLVDASSRKKAFANLATVIMETIRETDMAVQFSSDQVGVFTNCDSEQSAKQTLDKIVERVGQIRISSDKQNPIKLSVNAAQVIHKQDESLTDLITRMELMSTT